MCFYGMTHVVRFSSGYGSAVLYPKLDRPPMLTSTLKMFETTPFSHTFIMSCEAISSNISTSCLPDVFCLLNVWLKNQSPLYTHCSMSHHPALSILPLATKSAVRVLFRASHRSVWKMKLQILLVVFNPTLNSNYIDILFIQSRGWK